MRLICFRTIQANDKIRNRYLKQEGRRESVCCVRERVSVRVVTVGYCYRQIGVIGH